MHDIKHLSAALAVLLTIPFAACAGVEPSSESGATEDSSTSTASLPDAGQRGTFIRPVLTKNPLEYSNAELMHRGYLPRPDIATMPAAYEAWLKSVSKPKTMVAPITQESDMTNPDATSGNWSGIVNNTPTGGYSYVQGQWTVPAVTVNTSFDTFSSSWVGLDGWPNTAGHELWQAGTAQAIKADGTPSYYAWFQMYPSQREQRIANVTVSPGDVITAAVAIVDDQGVMTNAGQVPMYYLSNDTTGMTTGWQEWGSVGYGEVAGGSAEWIVERPNKTGSISSLADYGSEEFDNMTYGDDSGIHSGIDASTSIAVSMLNQADNNLLSQAFELSDSSASTLFYAPN